MNPWKRLGRKTRRWLKIITGALFFIFVWPLNLAGMSPIWSTSIEAQVVDAETGKPLENAVVIADWPSVTGTLAGGPYTWGTIHHAETRTKEDGFFYIRPWISMGFRDWITENHPTIRVHKAGYYSKTLTNNKSDGYGWIIWPKPWRSDWDERVIALEPIHWREWTKENWNENENKLRGSVSFEDCNWVKYPEIIIDDMRYLRRKGQILNKPGLGNRSRYWWREQQKCGVKLFPILKSPIGDP